MHDVAIIGAGMAGLAAAYRLMKAGLGIVVYERASRPGGLIRSQSSEGYLVEYGPNSIQKKTLLLEELIDAAGLRDEVIEARRDARRRFIVRGGALIEVPASPPGLIRSRLFSPGAKLRLLAEPFVAARPEDDDESVASFVRRRLGAEPLDYGVNPFVAGVFAGDPERLSVRHAFPGMFELERRYGSLLRGQIAQRRHRGNVTPGMFSFTEGLESLPRGLVRLMGGQIRTSCRVVSIDHHDSFWHISASGAGEAERFRAVIYAAPLHRLREISLPAKLDASLLVAVTYPPLSVVYHGYRRVDVSHALQGFGFLVPEVEREIRILGTLFSSSTFAGRAPEDHVLLTSFVGGMRRPDLARLSPDELHSLVHDDLVRLLGIRNTPIFLKHNFITHAIPQYHLGYERVRRTLEALESDHSGLHFAGNYRSGLSVADAAESGDRAARTVIESL